jgi:hypothetical protein
MSTDMGSFFSTTEVSSVTRSRAADGVETHHVSRQNGKKMISSDNQG